MTSTVFIEVNEHTQINTTKQLVPSTVTVRKHTLMHSKVLEPTKYGVTPISSKFKIFDTKWDPWWSSNTMH